MPEGRGIRNRVFSMNDVFSCNKATPQYIIYTAPDCPKCVDQKAKWDAGGIRYEERSADRIKNHEDDYDKEAHVEAAMNNERLPVIIKI